MTKININNAKENLLELSSSCIKNNDVIKIKAREGNVIMLSEKYYNNLMESLSLLIIPGMYESILDGASTPIEECEKIKYK